MSQENRSKESQLSPKCIKVMASYLNCKQFRNRNCSCLQLVFFVVVVVASLLVATTVYLDLGQEIQRYSHVLTWTSLQGDKNCSTLSCILNAVDLDELPPLPKLPMNLTDVFNNALTEEDVNLLSTILQTFHNVMVNASLQYFIYKGAVLGSYRHHSMIPWDDDLDVLVHSKDKAAMRKAFTNCSSSCSLNSSGSRYKFYSESGRNISKHGWKSPFIDVSFYNDNATHLWDITIPKQAPFLKSTIFPLRDRPFLGHLYPAPRDPLANLRVTYDIDRCYTGDYVHMTETVKNKSKIFEISCSALINLVPFVSHVRGPGGAWCEEVLTFRGQVLNTFVRDSRGIPVC